MEPRRRAHLTSPGEPLILTRDAAAHAARFQAFIEETALGDNQVLSTVIVSIPLPVARRSAGPRGWPVSMDPSALWHPLFWLPERLAHRYRDETFVETDNEWSVRVAMESTIAGLYDPISGTWVDVLSLVELDVDDPDVVERLRAWLAGADDAVLDSIDLSGMTELADDPHWAYGEVAELMPTLLPAAWSLTATSLLEELARPGATTAEHVAVVGNLALGLLSGVPAASETAPETAVVFQRALTGLEQGGVPEAVAEYLGSALRAIQADYLPFFQQLSAEVEQLDAA